MEIGEYYQQGDVVITKIDKIPSNRKIINRNERGFILAEGEATGHAHVIDDEIELYEVNNVLYLKVNKGVKVNHEEHKQIEIELGNYQIGQVREFDWFDEEIRVVRD